MKKKKELYSLKSTSRRIIYEYCNHSKSVVEWLVDGNNTDYTENRHGVVDIN